MVSKPFVRIALTFGAILLAATASADTWVSSPSQSLLSGDLTVSGGSVAVQLNFLNPVTFDLNFSGASDGELTITETIVNNTGFDWLDFTWTLKGAEEGSLALVSEDTPFTFSSPSSGVTSLYADGGRLLSGESMQVVFQVSGATSFTVEHKDLAAVPEPGVAVGLVGLGIALVGIRATRRERKAA